MPSNAMKISQLVAMLEGMADTHGDLDVILGLPGNPPVAVDGRNVTVQGDLPLQRLPAPCVVIGMWQNERGVLQNMVGQKYEVNGVEDGWFAAHGDAPEMTPLRVWTRYEGEKTGYVREGRWWLWDGNARPVEYPRAGILRWREAET